MDERRDDFWLAVLKRLGPEPAGMKSVPMLGYTLAVDFRESAKARALIADLSGVTAAASRRIYLAKDSLAAEALVKTMHPRWQGWAAEVAKHELETDLPRRQARSRSAQASDWCARAPLQRKHNRAVAHLSVFAILKLKTQP